MFCICKLFYQHNCIGFEQFYYIKYFFYICPTIYFNITGNITTRPLVSGIYDHGNFNMILMHKSFIQFIVNWDVNSSLRSCILNIVCLHSFGMVVCRGWNMWQNEHLNLIVLTVYYIIHNPSVTIFFSIYQYCCYLQAITFFFPTGSRSKLLCGRCSRHSC
jgi:hypothetical protein